MDSLILIPFLVGAFLGGLVSGLFGFAMGIVVSSIWLHFIPPVDNTVLIIGCTGVTQGYGIWKLRHALDWPRAAPFILGGAVGVPLGVYLLAYSDPATVRAAVGVLLVAYSLYSFAKPSFKPVQAGFAADIGVGMLNGLLGGLTGLVGIILVIWCQMRGWSKDVTRATFQIVVLAIAVIAAVSLVTTGSVTAEMGKLYLIALPLMLLGTWLGFRLYGRLDEAAFRKAILLFLLLSGVMLVIPGFV
jgi:uncharacterized protein